MLFYKVTGIMETNETPEEDRRARRENQRKIEMKSEEFNRNRSGTSFYFISEIDNTVVTAGVIADNKNKVESDLAEFFKYLDLTMKDVTVNEITFNGIENLLCAANRMYYIEDDDDVLERFGLDKITGRRGRGIDFGDNIIEDCSKEKIYESARKYLLNETFIPELDRIYSAKPTSKAYGHPVHYMIQTDDRYEKPPETFFKISKLMRRLETNVDHIWLGRSDLSEAIKTKYYKLSKALNNYDCEITFKGLFAEAH